jgi:hypothetical protein
MARTVKEIKDSMTAMWIQETAVRATYELDENKTFDEQFSRVSLESIWFYVVAFCVWTLEMLFDVHRDEMEALYRQQHAHTFEWYNNKAKAFMLGHSLVPFTSNYDVSGLTDEQVAAARIVTHASCVKGFNSNNVSFLRLKVAKQASAELVKLEATELEAFASYMAEIQDAGVDLKCTSTEADDIRMNWTVYYDPQVLDGAGCPLTGGESPVEAAIRQYVQELPFNGLYKITFHVDAVQRVWGVRDAYIQSVASKKHDVSLYRDIGDAGIVPDAGYFKFTDADALTITYLPFD